MKISVMLPSRVKEKRDAVGPNHGFLCQLKLYEKMRYQIDRNYPAYKRFRLHMAANKVKSGKCTLLFRRR